MSETDAPSAASGKGAGDENFPVGSWLLPAALRPKVALFYRVVRGADDIADSPGLSADEKIARLAAVDAALAGETPVAPGCEAAAELRQVLAETGVPIDHARDLLRAFVQDATKNRYDDWDDLVGYCRLSANPVGRFLLDLHGEDAATHAVSDALCTALQIINHLQDCQDDYRDIDRVYLPRDLLAAAGVPLADLASPAASPGLRWVLDRVLDGVDELIALARALPGAIRHGGMRREAAVIVAVAERLAIELRDRDPLAERVTLTPLRKLVCVAKGVLRATVARPPAPGETPPGIADFARRRVRRSGSSFYWAMRLLPRPRREAMFAVYAYCREVDDIADGPGELAAKRLALDQWRGELDALFDGHPRRALSRALEAPIAAFGLRRRDFDAILDGVAMDAAGPLRAPDMATLELYGARVAGAVGLLSVRIFGCRDAHADDFALTVGQALQLTNILRDVAEDAADGRLYLPAELLDAAGIESRDPARAVAHPALPEACAALARIAQARFAAARAMLAAMAPADRAALRPAVIMMVVYARLLDRLIGGGWRRLDPPLDLAKAEKLWIALRHAVL